jgi:hypothetical protein
MNKKPVYGKKDAYCKFDNELIEKNPRIKEIIEKYTNVRLVSAWTKDRKKLPMYDNLLGKNPIRINKIRFNIKKLIKDKFNDRNFLERIWGGYNYYIVPAKSNKTYMQDTIMVATRTYKKNPNTGIGINEWRFYIVDGYPARESVLLAKVYSDKSYMNRIGGLKMAYVTPDYKRQHLNQ